MEPLAQGLPDVYVNGTLRQRIKVDTFGKVTPRRMEFFDGGRLSAERGRDFRPDGAEVFDGRIEFRPFLVERFDLTVGEAQEFAVLRLGPLLSSHCRISSNEKPQRRPRRISVIRAISLGP